MAKRKGRWKDTKGYIIESLSKNGNLTGIGFCCRTGEWVSVAMQEIMLPSFDAAEAYCEEHGFELGVDVEITMHEWSS